MKRPPPPDPRDLNPPRPNLRRAANRLRRLLSGRDVISGGRTGGAYFDEEEEERRT